MSSTESLNQQILVLKKRLAKYEKPLDPIYLRPYYPKITSLITAKRLSGLSDILKDYFSLLKYEEDGKITKKKVYQFFTEKGKDFSQVDKERQLVLIGQICNCYSLKREDNFLEIILGILYVLSPNPILEMKLRFCFSILDDDRDGYLTLKELELFLRSSFRLLYEFQPGTLEMINAEVETLSRVTSLEIFRRYNRDTSGGISLEQLLEWYYS